MVWFYYRALGNNNRTYQWYGNSVADNATGTPISGAVNKDFSPEEYPEIPYYYCVVTTQDAYSQPIEIKTHIYENDYYSSKITKVEYNETEDTYKNFTVTATGRQQMIQFIEPDGGTRTYDRYNKNVSITSYDIESNVVNAMSRDIAYEVWKIYSNMSVGVEIKVRGKENSNWNSAKYSFSIEPYNPIISMELSATEGKKGPVPATVVADAKTEKVMFKMPNGTSVTISTFTTDENGNRVFKGNAWMNEDELNEINILIRRKNVWKLAGTLEYTVE